MSFWMGSPAKFQQVSNLQQGQQPLYNQMIQAGMQGPGGAFGQAANYYQDLLSNDSQTFNQMTAPDLRKFREEILPQINEQFSGMHGYAGSSSHQNALARAGTDLSERLAALRAQLRQQGAQGLLGIGQQGLNQYHQNVYMPREAGALENILRGVGEGVGAGVSGGFGAAGGALANSWLENRGLNAIKGMGLGEI